MAMKQSTLDGKAMNLNPVDCVVHGGGCGNAAEYRIQLSGNGRFDGGKPVLACVTCKDELTETQVEWVEELTEIEVFEIAEQR